MKSTPSNVNQKQYDKKRALFNKTPISKNLTIEKKEINNKKTHLSSKTRNIQDKVVYSPSAT